MKTISIRAITDVENFVIDVCDKRPPSHNHLHMMKVRNNALSILLWLIIMFIFCMYIVSDVAHKLNFIGSYGVVIINIIGLFLLVKHIDAITLMVNIVALLHDVADHKYIEEDPYLIEKLNLFLTQLVTNPIYINQVKGTVVEHLFDVRMIKEIIERISFSRQKIKGTKDWYNTLGLWGLLIRHIVSDGDKFEAIGKNGVYRCKDYTLEVFAKQNKTVDAKSVRDAVVEHYHEKLKLLATSEYMKTPPGWIYAKIFLDPEMQSAIKSL